MTPSLKLADIPDSPPARWDARWKLAAVLVAVAGIAALDRLAPAAVALALALLLLASARLPWKWVRFRLSLFVLAALPFVVILPFTLDGTGRYSERGLVAGLAVFCRCVAVGALALVLVGTAPVHRTITAAHKLKVPGLLVLLALLAYRYIFLLADERRRLGVALRVRGYRATATLRGYRTLGHVAGAVLVRGADRADRVSEAMRCRGFDGTFHTLTAYRTTPADVVSFLLMVAAAVGLVVWDRAH
jgi:cobalt/nickel transport system permease protein